MRYVFSFLILLFSSIKLCITADPPYFLQYDPSYADQTLGTSWRPIRYSGSALCSIAMALQAQNLLIKNQPINPLNLNLYLRQKGWTGYIDEVLWSSVEGLGLKLEKSLPYADLNTIRNFLSNKSVLIGHYQSSNYSFEPNVVSYVVGVHVGMLLVQNPSSNNPDSLLVNIYNVNQIFVLGPVSSPKPGLCLPFGCEDDPCSCNIFQCPLSQSEPPTDCNVFKLMVSTPCEEDLVPSDFARFLKCSLRSCPCPYFRIEKSSCLGTGGHPNIYLGLSIPLSTVAARLTYSSTVPTSKIQQIQSYVGLADQDLLNMMFDNNTGLTIEQENYLNSQYYRILEITLANMIPAFLGLPMGLKMAAFTSYVENFGENFDDFKVWQLMKKRKWAKVLKVVTGRDNYEGFKVPKMLDNLIASTLSCDNPFADVIILRNIRTTEYSYIDAYNDAILSLLSELDIGPKAINVYLASYSDRLTVHTRDFVSDKSAAIRTFMKEMQPGLNGSWYNSTWNNSNWNSYNTNYYLSGAYFLSQAMNLFSQSSRIDYFQSTSVNWPRIIVLFTSAPFVNETADMWQVRVLEERNIKLIIFTTSSKSSDISFLNYWASDDAVYIIQKLQSTHFAEIVENTARRYTTVGVVNLKYYYYKLLKIMVYPSQFSFVRFNVPEGGLTARIQTSGNIKDLTVYASSVFKYPNENMYDAMGTLDSEAYVLTQGKLLFDQDEFLYIGLKSGSEQQTVTIIAREEINSAKNCSEGCANCDYLGGTCIECKVEFELFIDECLNITKQQQVQKEESKQEVRYGTVIWKNTKALRHDGDYNGIDIIILIVGLVSALSLGTVVGFLMTQKHWSEEDFQNPDNNKEEAEKASYQPVVQKRNDIGEKKEHIQKQGNSQSERKYYDNQVENRNQSEKKEPIRSSSIARMPDLKDLDAELNRENSFARGNKNQYSEPPNQMERRRTFAREAPFNIISMKDENFELADKRRRESIMNNIDEENELNNKKNIENVDNRNSQNPTQHIGGAIMNRIKRYNSNLDLDEVWDIKAGEENEAGEDAKEI